MEDNVTSANTNTNSNTNKSNKTRKAAALGLAVLGIGGLTLASAAQLNMGTGSLGAGTTVVASCQPEGQPIGVDFESSFVATDGEYKATSLNLTSIADACNGLDYKVTVTDSSGNALGQEATGKVAGTSLNVPLRDVSAEDISNVAVVINS